MNAPVKTNAIDPLLPPAAATTRPDARSSHSAACGRDRHSERRTDPHRKSHGSSAGEEPEQAWRTQFYWLSFPATMSKID
jgi:hypothetical protein